MPKKQVVNIDGRELTLSNPEKVFFPASGFTKGEVVAFYSEIADFILPHLRDRPLTLKRYPDGITGEHFYEKNAPSHTPAWVKRFAVPRSGGGSDIQYILCNDRPTLLWATNLADIEKHVLLSHAPDLDHPTSVVFDLDPGEPAGLIECGRTALRLKAIFDAWHLQSFVKVSGSKGLHLTVPLNGDATYEVTQPFAKAIADLLVRQLPDETVSDMTKSLRKGKVLIDWSQNSDFKTTVCVYAMRAKREEPLISMPVTWDELARAVKRRSEKPLTFTPKAAIKRLDKVGDLFAPVLTLRQELPTDFTSAIGKSASRPKSAVSAGNPPTRRDKSLGEYMAKRDLSRTPEPSAKPARSRKGGTPERVRRFVIQKHQASHLHYDFRLEMEGVLRSWAVPKGPPTKLREARLAMHVEDHPLEYATFEGTIPPGNYGAGTVMVWDEGEYEDLTGNPTKAFYEGKMHLIMRGTKLRGEWIMVKDRRQESGEHWLLIKAGESMPAFTPQVDDRSAVIGRSLQQIAEANDAQWQSNRSAKTGPAKKPARSKVSASVPTFIEPMQCKPVRAMPEGDQWSFEIKFDGYRCLVLKIGDKVQLLSRNKKTLNSRFPTLAPAFQNIAGDFLLDGEIVALNPRGVPDFQLLQNSQSTPAPIYYYAFDLLHDGEPLLSLPIEERRARLSRLLPSPPADPLRISPLLHASSGDVLNAIRQLGLEGVVGKRLGSLYEPGTRSGAWIKHRTDRQQEFVIGGYIPGGRGFDSLLVGVYEGKQLLFTAKVKNGFVPRDRDEIFPSLKRLASEKCPFTNLPEKRSSRWGEALTAEKMKECRWVKPKLVCQVAFVEWTEAGHLRHCNFVGMRDDKKAAAVTRET